MNSDVDIVLVVTEEEYTRRVARDDLGYYNSEICEYPEGYVDGKIINEALTYHILGKPDPTVAINVEAHTNTV